MKNANIGRNPLAEIESAALRLQWIALTKWVYYRAVAIGRVWGFCVHVYSIALEMAKCLLINFHDFIHYVDCKNHLMLLKKTNVWNKPLNTKKKEWEYCKSASTRTNRKLIPLKVGKCITKWKSIFISFERVLRNKQKLINHTEFNSHSRYFILTLRVRPLKSISYEK
jgi:hypothetical protein